MNEALEKLLRFDPLAAVEDATGKRHEGWVKSEEMLALGMELAHGAAKRKALKAAGDTMHGDKLSRYLPIVHGLGFVDVFDDAFTCEGRNERLLILAHSDGLLLSFDTFTWPGEEIGVNAGNLYFNWRPRDPRRYLDNFSGRCKEDGLCVGGIDAREALVHSIDKIRSLGQLISPWVEVPMLWLVHHGETRGNHPDYRAITADRVARLPEWVRAFMGAA